MRAHCARRVLLARRARGRGLRRRRDGGGKPTLVVSAAASLKGASRRTGTASTRRTSSAASPGSDELAAQIAPGARPDVFAAANTEAPGRAVRREARREARRLRDQQADDRRAEGARRRSARWPTSAKPGVKLSIGAEGVPVGDYTREVLGGLAARAARGDPGQRALRRPRRGEHRRASCTQGGADAGFVYVTDVRREPRRSCARSTLPAACEPTVVYAAAVVRGAEHPAQAQAFIDGLLTGAGRAALRAAGFGSPPGP